MKRILTVSIAALALAACQPAGNTNSADLDNLKADVEELKADIYGKDLGACEEANYATMEDYADSLEGLPAPDAEDWHKVNGERSNVMTNTSGLQYTVVREGKSGGVKPNPTDIVKVNYHGFFQDGEKFDSSYERGEPISFPANGVIKGWIEALADMTPCEARTLYIPGDLAYGPNGRGSIPPNATLLFHVQLLGIKEKVGLIEK